MHSVLRVVLGVFRFRAWDLGLGVLRKGMALSGLKGSTAKG